MTASKLPAYTIIELLISISLLALLVSFGFSAYHHTQERQIMQNSAQEIELTFRSAQKKAIIGDKDCSGTLLYYQLQIAASTNTITTQAVCSSSTGTTQTQAFPNITFQTSATIRFQPLTNGLQIISPPNTTSLTLTFSSLDGSLTHALNIAEPGTITYQGAI